MRCEATDDKMLITYSRCHPTTIFNKDIAKAIATERAEHLKSDARIFAEAKRSAWWSLPYTQNTDNLVKSVCETAFSEFAVDEPLETLQLYYKLEWQNFVSSLKKVVYNNQKEQEKADVWKNAMAYSALAADYERISRRT